MDKVINKITAIGSNLTGKVGCGVTLIGDNTVDISTNDLDTPYGVIVQGCDSLTPGTYPSQIADGSLILVTKLGDLVYVEISAGETVGFNDWLGVNYDGTFYPAMADGATVLWTMFWGTALTSVSKTATNRVCLMRFESITSWKNLQP